MATEEKHAFIAETVGSYEKYYNRGFISYLAVAVLVGDMGGSLVVTLNALRLARTRA